MCGALLEKKWEGTSCAFNNDNHDFGVGEMQRFELNGHNSIVISRVALLFDWPSSLFREVGGSLVGCIHHPSFFSTLSTTHVC